MRKFVITLLVLLGSVCVLLGAAFLYREDLVRYGAGRFLSDGQLTLTRLQGLDVTSSQLTVDALEFLFNESGQRLVIDGLDVDFRLTSVSSAPIVDSITIESAQLLAGPEVAGEAAAEDDAASDSDTTLSSVLTLLGEFPLTHVEIAAFTLPGRNEPLAFVLERGDDQLAARVASGPLLLQAQFTQDDPAAAARLGITLTRDSVTVGDLALVLQPMGETYGLSGNGTLDIPDINTLLGELDQAPLELPLRAARLDWNLAGTIADGLRGAAGDGDPETFTLGFQEGSTVTLPVGIAEGLGEVALTFTDGAEFAVTSGAGLTVSSERVPLSIVSSWNEQPASVDAILSLMACELAANAACAIGFDGNASYGTYTLAGVIQVVAATANYQVKTQGLVLGGLPELVPAFDLDASIAVDDERITFSTPLLVRNTPADAGIALSGTYDLAASTANIHLALPELSFSEQGGALSAWFNAWPYNFDVLAGSIAAELDLVWRASVLTGNVSGNLKEIGGFYGDYFFRGLGGALQAEVDTSGTLPVVIPPLRLTAAGVDIGLPFEDLQLTFSLDRAGVLHIDSVQAHVLEGTISAMDIAYDFNRERNDILVNFAGLRMERMLDLVDYDGIEAIGAVSGQVPVTITPNGVEVAAGILTADAPGGSIRYLAAATAGATGNPGLDLVNQALGNYQFNSLTSDIDYKPDGELVLAMKLEGRNPDMSGGQRINLNLNLSDNIPALLESLQAARKIGDFLAEQYQ